MSENSNAEQGSAAHEPLLRHLFSSAPARERDATVRGMSASLLLHGVLIGLVLWIGRSHRGDLLSPDMGAGTGSTTGAAGGGGGGGAMEDIAFIQLTAPAVIAPPPPELTEPPPPVPPPLPNPTMLPEPTPAAAADTQVAAASAGTSAGAGAQGAGPGTGLGVGPGTGGGTGGGEGSGEGSGTGPGKGRGRALAPYPEFLLIPPTAPGNVRGKTVVVRLAIDEAGTVRQVELKPETGNRSYDRELRRVALGWKFKPALDAGNNPVAVQFDVTFTF